MGKNEYPVFCGKVVGVPAIMEKDGMIFTLVDYLTIKDEPTEEEVREAFAAQILSGGKDQKLEEKVQQKMRRAVIPMRLDPSVIDGADIRTRFGELKLEGRENAKTYEVEIIKGRSESSGDILILASLAQPRHTGFRYIKFIDE